MKQTKKGSQDAPLGDIAIVEGGSAAIVSMTSKLQPNKKEPVLKKKSATNNQNKAIKPKSSNSKAEPTKNSGALARQSSGSTASTCASSKKKRGTSKAEPPFPFYRDVSKATVSEGFESIVNLLRGRKNIVVLTGAGIYFSRIHLGKWLAVVCVGKSVVPQRRSFFSFFPQESAFPAVFLIFALGGAGCTQHWTRRLVEFVMCFRNNYVYWIL